MDSSGAVGLLFIEVNDVDILDEAEEPPESFFNQLNMIELIDYIDLLIQNTFENLCFVLV